MFVISESQAGDELQHPPDQAPPVQPPRLHANWGQDDHRYPEGLERPSRVREGIRGVAPGRVDEAWASGALGQEVQAQGRHSRGLDRWQRRNAQLTGTLTDPCSISLTSNKL